MIVVLLSLATLAVILWFYQRRKADVLPPGQIVYCDTDRRALNEPLTSHRLRLIGKPDYVYALSDRTVPGEVKKRRAGKWGPRDRDVMQLLTYCVLLEDVWGAVVTHGLLEYSDRRFTIAYGPQERQRVLELAEAVRHDRIVADVARDHQEAWKCGRCGFSGVCGQAVPQRD